MIARLRYVALAMAVAVPGISVAQTSTARDQAAQVASADRGSWMPIEGSHSALLAQRLSLDLRRATVRTALEEIAHRAGVALSYDPGAVPNAGSVSLHVASMTVSGVLSQVLMGTGLRAYVAVDDREILIRRALQARVEPVNLQGAVTIAGHVTDAALKTPLSDASVRIEGTTLGATTSPDGKYALTGVASGTYRVTARRVGYQQLTKDVTVGAGQTVTLDFALAALPTRLDEVVTTAVGQQRRYEVGNDISTINADSIAPTAPITSLTDLISARAPGVEVLETSGMTGSGEAIRIRGLSSLVLQNDPVLIVDGVRQNNGAGGDIAAAVGIGALGGATHPTPTRLNDIDFADVESIDILKGPAASTEYGTDAANGVIVIKTKHGTSGAPQWKASAEQTTSDMPASFPDLYYSWGHTTGANPTPVDCPLTPAVFLFSGNASTAGTCVVDSVTRWNPLNHSATSIFGTGSRAKYDLSVGGGSDAVRYFVSGGLSNETGLIQLPPVFRQLADTANIGLPGAATNSNSEQQRSLRVRTAMTLSPTVDLAATGSYLSTYQQTPNAANLYEGAFVGLALRDPAHYYGYNFLGISSGYTPLSQLTEIGSQNTERVTGGLTANWRPVRWIATSATVGIDHGSQRNAEIDYPLSNPAYQQLSSFLGLADATTDLYSVDLRGAATASVARWARAVTSIGLQIVDDRVVGQGATATNITPTNLTLNGATGALVTQQATRQATLGGYGEEELSFSDRLFVTGALRVDAASGFGRTYAVAAYPKASISWLLIDQQPTTVRIRGAFGESGVQPMNGAALQLFAPVVTYADGATAQGTALNWPGNPALRPERSEEFEGGLDVGGWRNRVSFEVTGYLKNTNDALVNVNLGGDACCYLYQENIGRVQNEGIEGSITLALAQGRTVTWDVAMNASLNHNRLVALAPGVPPQNLNGDWAQYRQAPGYPLYGLWARRLTYADANHDGVIEASEATIADSVSYIGPSLPTQEASISTHVSFWRGALVVSGLADYRGGYRISNSEAYAGSLAGNQQGQNDSTARLGLQARTVENGLFQYNSLYVEDGSFVRIREVALTYNVPMALVRAVRAQRASVTAAVRNLALWTRYTGPDPEVSNTNGFNSQLAPTTNGYVTNNDMREGFGAIPLARYWVVRLNVGF